MNHMPNNRVVGEIYQYQVQAGDSLYQISKQYQTTVALIAGINGIKENAVLQIGQELLIPVLYANQQPIAMRSFQATYPAMYF